MIRQRCSACPFKDNPLVRGCGPEYPDLCVVGEAPGNDEVKHGIPFIGQSGKLLRASLRAAGLNPDHIYFTNSCCCHPSGNETPTAAMVTSCRPWLLAELLAVRPKKILAVGATALQALMGEAKSKGISASHGLLQIVEIDPHIEGVEPLECLMIASYHPAYLLRNPDAFRSFAFDVEKLLFNDEPPALPEIVVEEVYE